MRFLYTPLQVMPFNPKRSNMLCCTASSPMGTVICIRNISEDKVNKKVVNTEHDEYSNEVIQECEEKKMGEVIQKKENG